MWNLKRSNTEGQSKLVVAGSQSKKQSRGSLQRFYSGFPEGVALTCRPGQGHPTLGMQERQPCTSKPRRKQFHLLHLRQKWQPRAPPNWRWGTLAFVEQRSNCTEVSKTTFIPSGVSVLRFTWPAPSLLQSCLHFWLLQRWPIKSLSCILDLFTPCQSEMLVGMESELRSEVLFLPCCTFPQHGFLF